MPKKVARGKQQVIAVKIQVEPTSATPVFYANYAEIAHGQHDFVLSAVRVPAKFGSARQADIMKSGVLSLEPEAQVTFPPTLVRPLIEALEKQLMSYERTVGKSIVKGRANGKK